MKIKDFKKLTDSGQVKMSKNGKSFIHKGNYFSFKNCKECGKIFVGQPMNNYCNISCGTLGSNNGMFNMDLTEKHREQGRATSQYYQWKVAIFNRDKRTCQFCGSQHNICSHHIEGYSNSPKLRTNVDNGITWCKVCHEEYHHIFGYNTTRDEFDQYMEDSIFKTME